MNPPVGVYQWRPACEQKIDEKSLKYVLKVLILSDMLDINDVETIQSEYGGSYVMLWITTIDPFYY